MEISPRDATAHAGAAPQITAARPSAVVATVGPRNESSAVPGRPDHVESNPIASVGYFAGAYRHAREAVLPQAVAEFLSPTECLIYVAQRTQLMLSMPILAGALVQGHREWRAGNRAFPLLMPWESAGEMRLIFWNGAVLYTLQQLTQRAARRREARAAVSGTIHNLAVPPRPAAPESHRAPRAQRAQTGRRPLYPTDVRI